MNFNKVCDSDCLSSNFLKKCKYLGVKERKNYIRKKNKQNLSFFVKSISDLLLPKTKLSYLLF